MRQEGRRRLVQIITVESAQALLNAVMEAARVESLGKSARQGGPAEGWIDHPHDIVK